MTNALVGNRYRPANFLARRSTRAAGTAAFRVRYPRWRDGRIGPIADFDHPKPPALVPKERSHGLISHRSASFGYSAAFAVIVGRLMRMASRRRSSARLSAMLRRPRASSIAVS